MAHVEARGAYPPHPASPRRARRLVHDQLQAHGFDGSADTAALRTSELATNAVLHTGEPFTISIQLDDGYARVEVCDPSNRMPLARESDPETPGGQGLRILDALADRWGIETRDGGGKMVWFEIRDR
ncbi:MAG: ATP-binding protein [Actinobacteria bacterium]|nr:ATP-binding protein [Actinomycetota bacterium]